MPAAVYAVILAFSSVPADRLGGLPDWLGTLGHAGGYALLAAALRWALRGTRAATATWVLVAVVVLAGVDELSQARVPGRDPSAGDVAVDLAGGALALVVLRAAGRG